MLDIKYIKEKESLISKLEDFNSLRELVGSNKTSGVYFKQTADFDLEGSADNLWTPIGSEANNFQGIYDGGNHVIKNMWISTNGYAGFFAFVKSATIKNLTFEGGCVNASSVSYVGALVGRSLSDVTIENVSNIGCDIVGKNNHIGGIIGNYYGDATHAIKIISCANSG